MNLILYGAELRWCEGINQYNNSVIFCGMIKSLCLFVFMSFLIFFFFFFVFLKICSISWSFLSVKHETCGRNVWGCWPLSWGECRRGARRRGRCRSRSSSRSRRCRSKTCNKCVHWEKEMKCGKGRSGQKEKRLAKSSFKKFFSKESMSFYKIVKIDKVL